MRQMAASSDTEFGEEDIGTITLRSTQEFLHKVEDASSLFSEKSKRYWENTHSCLQRDIQRMFTVIILLQGNTSQEWVNKHSLYNGIPYSWYNK